MSTSAVDCGIEKGDARVGVTFARRLVEQLHALRLKLGERAVDVVHLETDVIQTLALLGDPARRIGRRRRRLNDLQIGLAGAIAESW